MRGISCLVLPIPEHAFFEQAVFHVHFSDYLLERRRFRAQLLDLRRGRLAGRIPGQALLARFKEFLRPRIIQALADALTAAESGNAFFAPQARQHDPDLLFGRILFARLAADAFDQLVSRVLRCSGFLVHLRSIMAAMNQKSSVTKTSNLSHWR